MSDLGFDGRVAIVTGAGGGLGRAHSMLLASRGCLVVVNDIGGSMDGSSSGATTAEAVVEEIRSLGGEAVADQHSVTTAEGGQQIVQTALDSFGRVDVVVNNAGILRDKTFRSMTPDLLDPVLDVHLGGAFNVTRPAWAYMKDHQYGRVVFTSSSAGLFGNFGQSNYGAAKMGVVGLNHVLAQEGRKHGIKVNAIAPVAQTRMTKGLLGEVEELATPESVAPVVAYLAHEECPVSGHIFGVGAGRVSRVFVGMCAGWMSDDGQVTVEDVRDHFDEIEDTSDFTIPRRSSDQLKTMRREDGPARSES
jgi:NAD(P)-dependent dehydrogenase (short-subunit alcohol dehydrogenase family)